MIPASVLVDMPGLLEYNNTCGFQGKQGKNLTVSHMRLKACCWWFSLGPVNSYNIYGRKRKRAGAVCGPRVVFTSDELCIKDVLSLQSKTTEIPAGAGIDVIMDKNNISEHARRCKTPSC